MNAAQPVATPVAELKPHHHLFNGLVPKIPTDSRLRKLVRKLVEITSLQAISPLVTRRDGNSWMAFVVIAESHISVHGEMGRVWVDVFSCKEVNVDLIKQTLIQVLKGTWEHLHLRRSSPTAKRL